jgi:iron complex outermembrane receptor protein
VDSSGYNIWLAGQPINPAFTQYPDGIPDRKASFSEWQPKITWTWEVNEYVTPYASWGRGFRSGGFNSIGSEDTINYWYNAGYGGPGELVDSGLTINDEYDKEVTDSWEIGIKSLFWDDRVRFSIAYFDTNIEDNQFFEFFAGPFGLMRVVTTIDKVSISGLDINADFAATDYLRFYAGAGFLDSEIKANINRPLSVGNDVPQAPPETYNLGGELKLPISDDWKFMFRVDWQYVGPMWFHTLQGEEVPTIWQAFETFGPVVDSNMGKARRDAYDTIDARMSFGNANWLFTVWGRNLGDDEYLQEVIPAPEFGGSFIHPSLTRTYGLEVTYTY